MKNPLVIVLISLVVGLVAGGFLITTWNKNNSPLDESVRMVHRSGEGDQSMGDEVEYKNKSYGFLLNYPKEFEVVEYDEGNGSMTVVFQKPNEQVGFQIFITPYLETEITKDRLAMDVKGGSIREPTEVVIGEGHQALTFWSTDPLLGDLREVWLIDHGYLYEVTTYASEDAALAKIMKTWRFTK